MKKLFVMGVVIGLNMVASAKLAHYYSYTGDITLDQVGTANGTLHSYEAGSAIIDTDGSLRTTQVMSQLDSANVAQNGLQLDSSAVNGITGSFSVSMWATATFKGQANNALFCFTDNTIGNYVLGTPASYSPSPHGYPGRVEVAVNNTYQAVVNKTPSPLGYDALDDNLLHNWVFTYNGSDSMSLYIDGVLQDTNYTPSIDLSAFQYVTIAGGSPWPDVSMDGSSYAFGIFDNELSASDVATLNALGKTASVEQIQAIPEPASIALIGLVGGCAVFIRRRFMI